MPDRPRPDPAPLVTAIVPVYNAAGYVADTLASLRAQTLPAWEAVCVDDGSTDGSVDVLARAAAEDPRIRVVRQANAGVAAARNRGLDLARGRFVHFLDSDDLLEPEGYARLTDAALAAGASGFGAYGTFHVVSADNRVLVTQRRHEGVVGLREVLSYPHLQTVSHLMDRATLGDLRFDGRYPPYEDQHLWTQLAERGHRWVTVSAPVARYRIRPGSLSKHCERALLNSQEVMRQAFARANARPDATQVAPPGMLEHRLAAYALAYATRAVLLAHATGGTSAPPAEPGEAVAEGVRLLALADGPKGWSLDDAAKAAWWQAVYGLAIRPDPDRDAGAAWGAVLRAFWSAAAERGLLVAGDVPGGVDAAWERVFVLMVDPEIVVERLLRRLGSARAVTLVGMGQNGRALAAALRGRGLSVHARDDRYADGSLDADATALGVVGEAVSAPISADRPVVLTPLDDAALFARFAAWSPLRWSGVHAEVIAERRARRAAGGVSR